jgi:hypothetical protein
MAIRQLDSAADRAIRRGNGRLLVVAACVAAATFLAIALSGRWLLGTILLVTVLVACTALGLRGAYLLRRDGGLSPVHR